MHCFMSMAVLLLVLLYELQKNGKTIVWLFSCFCLSILALYSFSIKDFVPYALNFDAFFTYFVAVFYLAYCGALAFLHNIRFKTRQIFCPVPFKMYTNLGVMFSVFQLIRGCVYLWSHSYSELRISINNGTVSFHSAITVAWMTSVLYLENFRNGKRMVRTVLSLLIVALAILSTSKMFFVVAMLYVVPWYRPNFQLKPKEILFIVSLGLGGFFIYHVFTGRLVGGFTSTITNTVFTLRGYFLGGLAAFQAFLENEHMVMGWIRTGRWTGNVYSAFYELFREHNYVLFTIRTISISILYALLQRQTTTLRYLKIYALFPLLMIFFDEMFIKAWEQWLCFIIANFFVTIYGQTENIKGKYFYRGVI